MPLAPHTIRRLDALLGTGVAKDVADLIASGGNPVADNVAELGALTDIAGSAVATGGTPDCSAAAIITGIDTVIADVQADIDTLQAKVDAIIAAMVASGQMADS